MHGSVGKSLIWGGALFLAAAAHAGAYFAISFGPKTVPELEPVDYEIILPPLGSLESPVKEKVSKPPSKSASEQKPEPKPKPKSKPKPELEPKPNLKFKPKSKVDPIVPIEKFEIPSVTKMVEIAPTTPASNSEVKPEKVARPSTATQTKSSASDQSAPKPSASQANFGVSSGVAEGKENFAGTLQAWLLKHKRYPHRARSRRMQGVVQVWFRLDVNGNLLEARIVEGAGHRVLDKATLELLERVSPFPKPPDELKGTDLTFTVPVAYRLN